MEKLSGRRKRPAQGRHEGPWAAVALVALLALLLAGCAGGGASGGQTLSQQGNQRILSLAVDHFHPQLIYAGGDSGAVFDARPDRDVLFSNQSDLPSGLNVSAILPDTRAAGVVYIGTSRGVYKSSDFGATWQAAARGLPSGDTVAVLAFGAQPGTILAGTVQHGVYTSGDGGASWTPSNAGLPASAVNVNALLADPSASALFLAVDQAGLFTSTDGGQHWSRSGQGLPTGSNPLALAELARGGLNPSGPTLYAGASTGLFASKDGGATWSAVAAPTLSGSVFALATDPGQPGALYAATSDALLRSTDGGGSWTTLISGFSRPVFALAVVDTGAQPVVLASNDQVYRYPALAGPSGGPTGGVLFLIVLALLLGTGFWAFRRVRRQMRETMAHHAQANAERAARDGEAPAARDEPSDAPVSRNGHRPVPDNLQPRRRARPD